MITTLCLNPSFDRTVDVDSLQIGGTNRIRTMRTDAGGKGVNVMRVCRTLGYDAVCVMAAGEQNAPAFASLLPADSLRLLTVPGSIRTNTKIISLSGQPVTELNEPGSFMDEAAIRAYSDLTLETAGSSGWLILTGSLPPGCGAGTYAELIRRIGGDRCILDCSGEPLRLGLAERPYLIKPNRDELEATVGRRLPSRRDILEAARELMALGAQNVLVSMGSDGAMLVTPDTAWYAPCIPVQVRSTVGAGDAMLGGLICALSETGSLKEAFRHAVAAGTASVMTAGTQLVRVADYQEQLIRVTTEELTTDVL